MYKVMNKNNYGDIKEVKRLESKQYEVVGDKYLISKLSELRPDLINYNSDTNIATTDCPESLQIIINNTDRFKDYQFIFI